MKPYFQEDGITIYHGDCREILPRLLGMPTRAVVTDPPYNCGKNYGPGTDDSRPWDEWCYWWDGIVGLCRIQAPDVFAFMSQTAWRRYLKLGTKEPDWTLIWHKPLSLAVCAMPFMPHWEAIAYWGQTRKKDAFWGSDVLECNCELERNGHPTPKPYSLIRELVSRINGPICDPFCGSGTTLKAAKDLGLSAYGIEIEEKYCEIAAKRLAQKVLQF